VDEVEGRQGGRRAPRTGDLEVLRRLEVPVPATATATTATATPATTTPGFLGTAGSGGRAQPPAARRAPLLDFSVIRTGECVGEWVSA
jgi:hypothetical protein